MCRQEVPPQYLTNPQLLNKSELNHQPVFEDGYTWYYEGRNGKSLLRPAE